MKEITEAKRKARCILWQYVRQVGAIEIEVGDILVDAIRAFEVRDCGRRLELFPLFIGDARIGCDVADGKLRRVEIGDVGEQVFSDAEVGDPGSHLFDYSPGRVLRFHLFKNRTVRFVRAGQISRGQEELIHDLPTGKDKNLLEQFHPLRLWERVMRVQPAFEGAELFLQFENPARVDDGRVDLQAVADDARVRQQAGAILFSVGGDRGNVKAVVGAAKIIRLFEDGDPRQSRLVDLQHEALEEQVVVVKRESVLLIVVSFVQDLNTITT